MKRSALIAAALAAAALLSVTLSSAPAATHAAGRTATVATASSSVGTRLPEILATASSREASRLRVAGQGPPCSASHGAAIGRRRSRMAGIRSTGSRKTGSRTRRTARTRTHSAQAGTCSHPQARRSRRNELDTASLRDDPGDLREPEAQLDQQCRSPCRRCGGGTRRRPHRRRGLRAGAAARRRRPREHRSDAAALGSD